MPMKKQFVKALGPGDRVDDLFALSAKNLSQTRNGKPYLNLTVSDRTGHIKGVVWEQADSIGSRISSGDIVRVRGSVSEYRDALQIVIREAEPGPTDGIDPADFMPACRRDVDGMFERLVDMTAAMEKAHWRALFELFWLDEAFVGRFKSAPAAKIMHHAYGGGLLEHVLSMASLADKIGRHYEGVDRELLVAGAILHDIGKTREFDYLFRIDYSDEGRLLNHITLGLQMIDDKLRQLDSFPPEQALLLKHLVVSHHGAREFGSPEPPKTIEAVLLNYIDEIDAKVNGIREFMAAEDPSQAWTSYHRILERHFYRGRGD